MFVEESNRWQESSNEPSHRGNRKIERNEGIFLFKRMNCIFLLSDIFAFFSNRILALQILAF